MSRKKFSKHDLKRIANGQLPRPTEDDTQALIVDGLRFHGCLVLVTSRRVKRCRSCGAVNHVGDGASKGIGDLLVRRPGWPRGVWLQFEVKREGAIKWTSKEQQLLAEAGDVTVVQSLDEALAAVDGPDGGLGVGCLTPPPPPWFGSF